MKKLINEVKRMQRLAGLLKENEEEWNVDAPKEWNLPDMSEFLPLMNQAGITPYYLSDMEGIESGSEEWMDFISLLTGKNPYEDNFTIEEEKYIQEVIEILEANGIELI